MADQVDYEIVGDDFQAVNITLDSGESVRAEPGAMMFVESGIHLETSTGGGLLSGLKRKLGGESFFITTFENRGPGSGDSRFLWLPTLGRSCPSTSPRGPSTASGIPTSVQL